MVSVRRTLPFLMLALVFAFPAAALSPAPLTADAPDAPAQGVTADDLVPVVTPAEIEAAMAECRPTAISPAPTDDSAGPMEVVTGSCNGIRPGARVRSPVGGCTMSWILTDGTDLYATIAGHCARVGHGITLAEDNRRIGTMVYSVDQPIGEDFGVFKIDAEDAPDVDPAMCAWGGATGVYESGDTIPDGDVIVHQFGYGLGFGSIPPTRARSGAFYYENGAAFAYQGAVAPGDSGSPARLGDGRALGVVTDVMTVRTPGTGPLVPSDGALLSATVAGTLLDHGLARTEAATGLQLTLVTAPNDFPVA